MIYLDSNYVIYEEKKRSFYQDNVVSVFDTFLREWSISTPRYIFTTYAGIVKDSYILYPLPWTSEHSNQFHPLAVCDNIKFLIFFS